MRQPLFSARSYRSCHTDPFASFVLNLLHFTCLHPPQLGVETPDHFGVRPRDTSCSVLSLQLLGFWASLMDHCLAGILSRQLFSCQDMVIFFVNHGPIVDLLYCWVSQGGCLTAPAIRLSLTFSIHCSLQHRVCLLPTSFMSFHLCFPMSFVMPVPLSVGCHSLLWATLTAHWLFMTSPHRA